MADCENRIDRIMKSLISNPICKIGYSSCLFPNLSSTECPFLAYSSGKIDLAEHNRRIPTANELNAQRGGNTQPVNLLKGYRIQSTITDSKI